MPDGHEFDEQSSDGSDERPLDTPEVQVAEITFAEFTAAKKDPEVADFLELAKAENEQWVEEGMIHF